MKYLLIKSFLFLFFIIVLFSTCKSNKSEAQIEDEKKQKEKMEDSLRKKQHLLMKKEKEIEINKLTAKYTIKFKLDTLDYDYTIEFKKVLESQYQLIEDFDINDIYEKGSATHMEVSVDNIASLDIIGSKEQFDKIMKNNKTKIDFILVINLTDIKKFKLSIRGIGEVKGKAEDDDQYASVYIEDFIPANFIGSAKLIDVIDLK